MDTRPNIIVIMTDQQRADVSAREHFPLDTTPFLDHLADQGVWFDRAYTAAPVCAPARTSFLTGRFPSAHRVRLNMDVNIATYQQDLIGVMHDQRYATALIGKNHTYLTPDRFDHWFPLDHYGGFQPGRDVPELLRRHPDSPVADRLRSRLGREPEEPDRRTEQEREFDLWLAELNHGTYLEPTPFPVECQGPHRAVSEACRWIDGLDGHPFFLWLSIAEPHNPFQVPEPYFSMFPPQALPPVRAGADALARKSFAWRWTKRLGEYAYPEYDEVVPRTRANYFGMLRLIDDQVRRFVAFLENRGLRENTLIVFVSDHGDFVGEYGLVRKGPELPEVLTRIPLFFAGWGVPAHDGPHPAFVSIVDIMPTLCEVVGAPLPPGTQGRSLWPLVTGGAYPAGEFASVYAEQGFGGLAYGEADAPDVGLCLIPGIVRTSFDEQNTYSQAGMTRMVRTGEWKLVFNSQGQGQLYDLSRDPAELENLYDQARHADVRQELLAALALWMLRVQDPLPYPSRDYFIKSDPRNYWTAAQAPAAPAAPRPARGSSPA